VALEIIEHNTITSCGLRQQLLLMLAIETKLRCEQARQSRYSSLDATIASESGTSQSYRGEPGNESHSPGFKMDALFSARPNPPDALRAGKFLTTDYRAVEEV
jgi:hypothetical protein